ncbi:MAG: DNA/RNA non-specific endonuclease, partial [Prevotella sp.]|nr:DNA/RNA non-specific endonuclease [Prevotella sp.]
MIVPKYFYMAVLCKNTQGYKAIAFWAQHLNSDHSNDNLIDYVISIDELENRTGIDFFCNLPDYIEDAVEALPREIVIGAWFKNQK